jgi:hypothetical protein
MIGSPVLPEVASMIVVFPGTILPVLSASSTMRAAILSLTDPPTDRNSTLATEWLNY